MSLKVKQVSKNFIDAPSETPTLSDVSLDIEKGSFVCLVGPSGCGKSTLLNIIAGFEKSSSGEVMLNEKPIREAGPDRVMMFQESALFPWLKVIDNVEFGMKTAGIPKVERREKALHYLRMVHLTKFADCYIHQLSGGMKQRVALARALTMDSDILLMDEPFAALDSQTKAILHRELQIIWEKTKKTIVFVTHSVEEAVLLADRVIVMTANPGRIKKDIIIQLPRPREIDDVNVAFLARDILKELKEEVELVAKAEFDQDWNLKNDGFTTKASDNIGDGI